MYLCNLYPYIIVIQIRNVILKLPFFSPMGISQTRLLSGRIQCSYQRGKCSLFILKERRCYLTSSFIYRFGGFESPSRSAFIRMPLRVSRISSEYITNCYARCWVLLIVSHNERNSEHARRSLIGDGGFFRDVCGTYFTSSESNSFNDR